MRRQALRWTIAAIVFVIFGALMWLWREGVVWLVHSGYGLLVFPIGAIIIAFGWYAERKGWLT